MATSVRLAGFALLLLVVGGLGFLVGSLAGGG
jgi:hypothetical protein